MLAKISNFVKGAFAWLRRNLSAVLLAVLVALAVLFSFASGYIIATYHNRQPITIEQPQ